MNMGVAEGQFYSGRTVPLLDPRAVFVAAASLPPLSDEGDMRASTPYRAGVNVVHEMRHLWQAAHGWDAADKGKTLRHSPTLGAPRLGRSCASWATGCELGVRTVPATSHRTPRGAYGPQGSTCPPSESGACVPTRHRLARLSGHLTAPEVAG
jgi:hypothetical protein